MIILWTGNNNGNEDDEGDDESDGDEDDDYPEDDDNDDDVDDGLIESEYESSDDVSETGGIPIIEIRKKGEIKQFKAGGILLMVLFIIGPWLETVLQLKNWPSSESWTTNTNH